MESIPVAFLNIRGANLLVAFFEPGFDSRMPEERSATYAALHAAAARENINADVAAVWEDAEGRMRFLALPQQHPFFQVATYGQLRAQVNGRIQI